MRLLLVSKHFAPAQNPRAFRWTEVARRWAAEGHRVEVVCGRAPGRRGHEQLDGLSLHRVGVPSAGAARAALERMGSPESLSLLRDGPLGWAKRWLTAGWDSVRWPDESCLWYPAAALRARSLAKAAPFDALVTVSDPFTDHLVGLTLKASFPLLPWLADVGDPFSLLSNVPRNNPRLFGALNRRLEREVFTKAYAVAFTSQATRDAYARLFPNVGEKMKVIPPLAPAVPAAGGAPALAAGGKTKLVFSGTLDRRTRDPAPLLALFAALSAGALKDRVELHFFGRVSDTEAAFSRHASLLGREVFLHGSVDRPAAARAVRDADVLVNIGFREAPLQLPSKVVEYAAAGKPILNVLSRPDDCSAAFFAGYPAALTVSVPDEAPPPEIIHRVEAFLSNPPAVPTAFLDAWTAPFRLDSIAPAYLALLAPSGAGR